MSPPTIEEEIPLELISYRIRSVVSWPWIVEGLFKKCIGSVRFRLGGRNGEADTGGRLIWFWESVFYIDLLRSPSPLIKFGRFPLFA